MSCSVIGVDSGTFAFELAQLSSATFDLYGMCLPQSNRKSSNDVAVPVKQDRPIYRFGVYTSLVECHQISMYVI